MRLFRVNGEEIVDEVNTTERLAGVYDAVHVARATGDGEYDADFGDGSVMRFSVKDGMPSGIGPDSVRNVNLDDRPHRVWDNHVTSSSVNAPVSSLGAIFDENTGGEKHADLPAVEEF